MIRRVAPAAVLAASCAVAAPSYVDPALDPLILRGVSALHADRIGEALAVCDSVISLRADQPIGYFFKTAVYQVLIDDYRNPTFQQEFDGSARAGIERGERVRVERPDDVVNLLYLGGLYGYSGINKALRDDWYGGFLDGRKGKNVLEEVARRDSTIEDVYYGLGSYYYWAALKAGVVSFLVGGDKAKGIRLIIRTIERGHYARIEATYALLRVYYNEGLHDKVLAYWRQLRPVNAVDPFSLWFVIRSEIKTEAFDAAERDSRALLDFFRSSPYYDPAAEVECRYLLARALAGEGDKRAALQEVATALALEPMVVGRGQEHSEEVIADMKSFAARLAIE